MREGTALLFLDTAVAPGAKQHQNFARNSPRPTAMSFQVKDFRINP